jgi:elongator complex protein 1
MLEGGITALAWSPDYELVALTTGKQRVLLLTQEWDMVGERTLDGSLPPEDVEGEQLEAENDDDSETALAEETEDVPALSAACLPVPTLAWRGDGKYLVVSSTHTVAGQVKAKRTFRVWSREFQVISTCDDPLGMYWRNASMHTDSLHTPLSAR